MSSNHKLAKNILDGCFNKICELIKWKGKTFGKYYYPSSKICNYCDSKTEVTNNLNVRTWVCEKSTVAISEFKPMENKGYFIFEVGMLGGNDQSRIKN